MKQKGDTYILFPKKQPKTILGLYRWHRRLLERCLHLELRKRAIEAALAYVKSQLQVYVAALDNGFTEPAQMALKQLNALRDEWAGELEGVKAEIRIVHDTNEMIISNLLAAHIGEEVVRHMLPDYPHPGSNLLHGEGWMVEIMGASELEKRGEVGFVTFGTLFDPAGYDVIAFDKPRRRIRFKVPWPKEVRSGKPSRRGKGG